MKVLVLITLLVFVQCDLPVHCLKHQVVGKWKLFVEKSHQNGPGLYSCGHDIPDHADTSYMADRSHFKEDHNLEVLLDDGYSVRDPSNNQVTGSWTMVYDEGFEITHNNIKYFAFSKYEPSGGSATSYCDQTLIGWYNNKDSGDRGCYRAEKSEKVEASDSLGDQVSVVSPDYMNEDDMKSLGFLQKKQSTSARHYAEHQEIVDKLNAKEGTWKAKVYDHLVGKNYAELSKQLGRKKAYKEKQHHKKQQHSEKSFVQTESSASTKNLPKSYSWSEKLAHPRQQAQCGSCYAIATMEMLSARLKIAGEHVDLSPQWSLNCNYYNQGCDGGYPYLVNRFAEESYLVPESVEPYRGVDGECNYNKIEGLNKLYLARNYKYLGGAYGRVNEEMIMEEILKNGPVTMSFEPSYDFMYYESGIYHSKAESSEYPEWEKVDHSVLCYGWGEEDNGEKYWLLQNSWGSDWGENGTFRMKRGVDESAIESMVECAEPYVVTKGSSYAQKKETPSHNNSYESNDLRSDDYDSIFAFQQLRQNMQ